MLTGTPKRKVNKFIKDAVAAGRRDVQVEVDKPIGDGRVGSSFYAGGHLSVDVPDVGLSSGEVRQYLDDGDLFDMIDRGIRSVNVYSYTHGYVLRVDGKGPLKYGIMFGGGHAKAAREWVRGMYSWDHPHERDHWDERKQNKKTVLLLDERYKTYGAAERVAVDYQDALEDVGPSGAATRPRLGVWIEVVALGPGDKLVTVKHE